MPQSLDRRLSTALQALDGKGVVSVYLFGSHAEDRAHRESDVDVVVLNDGPPGLGRQVVSRGRRLACFDPDVDNAFVRDVQLRAADLDPFLQRARRVKLEALAR